MHYRIIGLTAALATVVVAPAHLRAESAQDAPASCEVTVKGVVTVKSPTAVVIDARTTKPIGEPVTATFDEKSQIVLEKVEPTPDVPQSIRLTLATAKAVPGEWDLTLKGGLGVCAGKVKVVD